MFSDIDNSACHQIQSTSLAIKIWLVKVSFVAVTFLVGSGERRALIWLLRDYKLKNVAAGTRDLSGDDD